MKRIQIILDEEIFEATNRAVRKLKSNRSTFCREALRAHLNRLDLLEKERQEREAYLRYPDTRRNRRFASCDG